jgi:quercetin dioxygenase-like cupin family protein
MVPNLSKLSHKIITIHLNYYNMSIIESKTFFITNEEPVYDVFEGVKRQFLAYNQDIMAVKVFLSKDAVGALHEHPHTQVAYVVSGVFDYTVGSETKRLYAGDACYVKSNLTHGCVCIEKGCLIEVFTPLREDLYSTISCT